MCPSAPATILGKRIEMMETFFNDPAYKRIVEANTQVQLPRLRFEYQGKGDPLTMHRNQMLALHYFAFGYTAYVKFCQANGLDYQSIVPVPAPAPAPAIAVYDEASDSE